MNYILVSQSMCSSILTTSFQLLTTLSLTCYLVQVNIAILDYKRQQIYHGALIIMQSVLKHTNVLHC